MIEPRAADESVFATLSRAKSLIEGRDFDSAALLYFELLNSELEATLRGEVLSNLAAALCILAQTQPESAAMLRLDQARELLLTALPHRKRKDNPAAWATTRANLALVYLARYEATGNSDDLLSGHLALDGIEQAVREADQAPLRDWVAAIRDHLLELRERRGKRR